MYYQISTNGEITEDLKSLLNKLNKEQEERMEQKKKAYFSSTGQSQDPVWKSYSEGYRDYATDKKKYLGLDKEKTLEDKIKHTLFHLKELQGARGNIHPLNRLLMYVEILKGYQSAVNFCRWDREVFDYYSFDWLKFKNVTFDVEAGCILNIKKEPRCYLGIKMADGRFMHQTYRYEPSYPCPKPVLNKIEITSECMEIMQELKEICMRNGFTCCEDGSYVGWDIENNLRNKIHKFDKYGEYAIWDWIPRSEIKQRLGDLIKFIISQSKVDERFEPKFSI